MSKETIQRLCGLQTNTSNLLNDAGITSTIAELNKLDGVTVTTAEFNKLDGITIQQSGESTFRVTDLTDNTSFTPAGTTGIYHACWSQASATATVGETMGSPMAAAGEVVSLAVHLNTVLTGGSTSVNVTPYKLIEPISRTHQAGASTTCGGTVSITSTCSGGYLTANSTYAGSWTFAAGDCLCPRIVTAGIGGNTVGAVISIGYVYKT